MEKALDILRETGDFDKFVKASTPIWGAIARYLLRKWKCPAGVDEEDVLQELVMNAWLLHEKFDPTRGVSMSRNLIYTSTSYTKRWIHKQRNAIRRQDTSPGRFETPMEYDEYKDLSSYEATQDSTVDFTMQLEAILKHKPMLANAITVLESNGFDRDAAISELVESGLAKSKSRKLVSTAVRTLREVELLW